MENLFLSFWNRSVAAGWLILAVIILRLALKRAPKSTRRLLWGLVGLRLLCPFSVQSALSLIPSAETIPQAALDARSPRVDSGLPFLSAPVNDYLGDRIYEGVTRPVGYTRGIAACCAALWLIGMALLLLWALVSWLRLRRRVAEAVPEGDGVWLCGQIDSPFLLGLLRPRIYLPEGLDGESRACVLAHERAHLRRGDHWIKLLAYLLLAVYWFQPLVWIAYVLLCRDIELACDERVIRELGPQVKKAYSEALLRCSARRSAIAACPLAFGEAGVKERVKNVLHYRKPAFWAATVSVLVCAAAAVCFLTDPLGFRLDLEENPVVSAAVLDMRFSPEPRQAELTPNQLDELSSRLEGLRSSPAGSGYGGLTPLYQINIQLRDGTAVTASGYSADGQQTDITMGGRTYRVDSGNQFAAYLSHICSGGDMDAAGESGPIYTGGALLYERLALNYLPADGSFYHQVQEIDGRLEITFSDGSTFSGELADQGWWDALVLWASMDDYALSNNTAKRLCPAGSTLLCRFYRDGDRVFTVFHLDDGRVWLGEGDTQLLRLYDLIDPAEAFPNPPMQGSPWLLWTANGRNTIPIRFDGNADISVNTGTLYRLAGDGQSGQSVTVRSGELVCWSPCGEDGKIPDNAVLHYILRGEKTYPGVYPEGEKDPAISVEDIKLRPVSGTTGDYGVTFGLSIDWLGAYSSKAHASRLTQDPDTGVLVVTTEQGTETGVGRVSAGFTVSWHLQTEDASAG